MSICLKWKLSAIIFIVPKNRELALYLRRKRGWILFDFGKIIILLDDVWKLFLLYCFSFESSFLFLCTCECACVCVFRLKKWKLTDVHQPFKLIHPWRFIKFGQIFLVSLLFDFVVLLNYRYYSGIHYR